MNHFYKNSILNTIPHLLMKLRKYYLPAFKELIEISKKEIDEIAP
jgi:hypothetical protein